MRFRVLLLAVLSAPTLSAADLVVDASGGGDHLTVAAAMAQAQPNDRILVRPGQYPAYQHFVAVDVIGVGADPSQVTIDRVDYHVSIPVLDYDTLISNVTIGSASPADAIAISGNELPPGTLHLDGVVVDGGVYLGGGATGFSLLVTNSRIENQAGEGFFGAAVDVGGANNFVEVRNSRIVGADADPLHPASDALRLKAGTTLRLVNAEIVGGDGVAVAGLEDGGDAVVRGFSPGAVSIRIDGGSSIAGGAAAVGGAGGNGVDVAGSIDLGAASVTGGAGTPNGDAYADAGPTAMPVDLHLALTPVLEDASGAVGLTNGESFALSMTTPSATTAIVLSFDIDLPPPSIFLSVDLPASLWIPGNSVPLTIPHTTPIVGEGLELYAQGFTLDTSSGAVLLSDAASVRLDLTP